MPEPTTIADLLVGLGVKADPNALAMLERFDALTRQATSAVKSFAKVASAGSASIAALGASGAALSPLVDQLSALQERMAALKSAGKVGTVASPSGAPVDRGAEASLRATAKAADQQAAAVEKARAKLETIGASASAVDKVTLAFRREQEAILAAAAATGDDEAAVKALTASEAKHAAALTKIAEGEKKAAENAAKMAMEERRAAQDSSLFGANNIANFAGAMGIAVGVIEQVAKATAVAAASVAALGTALAANSLHVAQDALQVERQADAIGLSTEEYQRAAYAFERYGVQAEKIPELLGKIATKATDAKGGSKDAAAAFKALGVSSSAYLKMKPEQQLAALADGFQKITDPSKRAALASKLLGDEMAKTLVPLLMTGSEGLEELGDQAEDFGLILSEDTIEESKSLTHVWATLTGIATGLQQQLGARLIPILAELGAKLLDWLTVNKDIIDQKFEVVVSDLVVAFDQLSVAGTALSNVFGGLRGFFDSAGKLYDIAAALLSIGKYVAAFTAALYPVTALGAAFTAVGLAVQDFYTYLTGGESIVGTLIDQFGQTDTLLGALIRAFQALGNVAGATFNLLSVAFFAAWTAAAPFRDLLSEIAGIAGGVLLSGIQVLTGALTDFLNVLTTALNGVAGLLGSSGAITGAQAVGATLGTGGAAGAVTAPAAGLLATALAPTSAAPAAQARTVTNTVTIGGATVNGSGLSPAELSAVLQQHSATQARQVQAALIGTEI